MHVVVLKGRAVQGEPTCLTVLPKQKNLTLTAALSCSWMIYHMFISSCGEAKRSVDANNFWLFLLDLRPHLPAFSKVKKMVSKVTFHNKEELQLTIAAALPSVSANDAQGWFLHMLCFYQQCALSLPFRGKPLMPTLCLAITLPSVAQWHQ